MLESDGISDDVSDWGSDFDDEIEEETTVSYFYFLSLKPVLLVTLNSKQYPIFRNSHFCTVNRPYCPEN